MKTKIYVPDIECDSCVKLITKKLKNVNGVDSFTMNEDSVEVNHDTSVKTNHLIQTIKDSGFRASLEPFDRKTLKERMNDFRENKAKYKIEITGLKYILYSFFILTIIDIIAYYGFLRTLPNFINRYAWYIFYLNVSIAFIGGATWHYLSYKTKVTCMTGMMVGMAFGMQAGMMLGIIIGATNGFFVGALVGMILGVVIGALTGKCCGIMGVMQGMMAGVMGGTMGPMISVMMLNDNLLIFMPFYMVINVIITLGLSYMYFEEAVEGKKDVSRNPSDFMTFISACIIIAFVLMLIILYGPKSAVVNF